MTRNELKMFHLGISHMSTAALPINRLLKKLLSSGRSACLASSFIAFIQNHCYIHLISYIHLTVSSPLFAIVKLCLSWQLLRFLLYNCKYSNYICCTPYLISTWLYSLHCNNIYSYHYYALP